MSRVTYFFIFFFFLPFPPPKKNIGAMIRIGREIQCLPYAVFFPMLEGPQAIFFGKIPGHRFPLHSFLDTFFFPKLEGSSTSTSAKFLNTVFVFLQHHFLHKA